jgi:hypothetical protein
VGRKKGGGGVTVIKSSPVLPKRVTFVKGMNNWKSETPLSRRNLGLLNITVILVPSRRSLNFFKKVFLPIFFL